MTLTTGSRRAVLALAVLLGPACPLRVAPAQVAMPDPPFEQAVLAVEARDRDDRPVADARIHVYSSQRILSVSATGDHVDAAATTDREGRAEIALLTGTWDVLAVGRTDSNACWVVSRTVEVPAPGTTLLLEPDRRVELERRGINAGEASRMELFVRPETWPSWWRPPLVHNPPTGRLELGCPVPLELWQRSHQAVDDRQFLAKVLIAPDSDEADLGPPERGGGRLTVKRAKKRTQHDTAVFFVFEPLGFRSSGHSILYRVEQDPIEIDLPYGDYLARHYIEWFPEGKKWHAEFGNETLTFSPEQDEHTYLVGDQLDLRPGLQVFDASHAQFWLDGQDEAGHRLDWLSTGTPEPYGKLTLFDGRDRTHELELHGAKHFWTMRGGEPRFPLGGRYRFQADLKRGDRLRVEGGIVARLDGLVNEVELPHVKVRYPRGVTDESAEELDRRAASLAPLIERMIVGAYDWYDLEAPTGLAVDFQVCSPTAGGSSGRFIALSNDYLLRASPATPRQFDVFAHELGHSLHVIDPLDTFLQGSDRDHVGLYNESQASFMGDKGLFALYGEEACLGGVAYSGFRFLRYLQGETEHVGDVKSRLHYLTWHLQLQLGEEFSRRALRLGHLEPRDVRDRLRAQDWTPIEKIAGLFSVAAGRDLTEVFQSARFEVRDEVCGRALELAR